MRRMRRVRGLHVLLLGFLLALGTSADAAQESWDAVFLAGAKIGFVHTYLQPVKDRGRDLIRVRVDTELSFKRDRDAITMSLQYGTIETPDGSVLRLDTRTQASETELRTHGDVIDNKMTLIIEGSGRRQEQVIPWTPDVRGPYAAEMTLARQPMKPGETRTLKMFVPEINKIYDIKLEATKVEDVALGGGKRSLLRVEQTASNDGKPAPDLNTTFWVDSAGQVLKSFTANLGGMTMYRTTREGAMSGMGERSLDLIATSIIKIVRKIDKPDASRNIIYRVAIPGEDPTQVFPTDRRQSIRKGKTNNDAILEVKSAGPNDGTAGPERVAEEYLRPNTLITSDDPEVANLARKAVTDALDPWEKAVRIERWVAKNLVNKNFKTGFAPANEVARNLTGDCTEHSVLSAAMCRAQGIPARVAVGLVYADNLKGFGYHMWNEVYVNRRWVALDASFDETSVDAVHLKLSDSSMDGVSPFEAFLPVSRVMGRLTIEPLEIR